MTSGPDPVGECFAPPRIVYHGKPKGKAVRLGDLNDLPHLDLACYVPTFDIAFSDFSPEADEDVQGNAQGLRRHNK